MARRHTKNFPTSTRNLNRILEGDLCSGCGLCASIIGSERASMNYNEQGFLRPVLTGVVTQQEDQLIGAVCPGLKLDIRPDERGMEGVWGSIYDLATGHAVDSTLRYRAASGGALTAVAAYVIDAKLADYVLHIEADRDTPWLNQVCNSVSSSEAISRAGSRYAPSSPLQDVIQRIDRGDKFLVVGKPCDIAALRQYGRIDPRVGQQVVAMLAFMCGGVPSRDGTERLLEKMKAPPSEVELFRYRGFGWPGRTTARLFSGEERSVSYSESWGGVLSSHVQLRCKICPDGMGRFADIVFADAWYGDESGYPLFDEADGRSLVLVRNTFGRQLVDAARSAKYISLDPLEVNSLDKMQPYQAKRTRLTLPRIFALAVLRKPFPKYRGFNLMAETRRANFWLVLRNFLGMIRRAYNVKKL